MTVPEAEALPGLHNETQLNAGKEMEANWERTNHNVTQSFQLENSHTAISNSPADGGVNREIGARAVVHKETTASTEQSHVLIGLLL